jgi:hypothetical protein
MSTEYTLTVRTDSADLISEHVKAGLRFEKKEAKAAEVGDNAAGKANAKPKTKPPVEEAAPVSPETGKPEDNGSAGPSAKEVKSLLSNCLSHVGEARMGEVLLSEFKCAKFSDISPDDYPALAERCEEILRTD